MGRALQSLAELSLTPVHKDMGREGGMDPGEGKTTEIKSFNTRIKGSNYPAMAGVGDQESPILGGRSSWAQGANHHFNTYLVMFMPGRKNLWHPTSFGRDFQEEICP